MDIRTALRQLRAELKMGQADLAQLLQVSNITVNRWENGKSAPNRMAATTLLALAKQRGTSTVCQAALRAALFPAVEEDALDDLKYAEIARINELVNDSSNAVVVCDQQSYEILYMNRKTAEITGQTVQQAVGMKCYEYLKHTTAPCKNCRDDHADTDKYTEVTYQSPRTGCYYLMRGKRIEWKGRPAYLEYITDTTELYEARIAVERSQRALLEACSFADIWFCEYDMTEGIIRTGTRAQRVLDLPPRIPYSALVEAREGRLDAPSLVAMKELFQKAQDGVREAEAEILLREKGVQRRFLVRMNRISVDATGRPAVAIFTARRLGEQD